MNVRFRREIVAARKRPLFLKLGALKPDVTQRVLSFAADHTDENILADAMANRSARELSSGDGAYLTNNYAQIELQNLRAGGDPDVRTDYTKAADPALMAEIEILAGPCHRTRITRLDPGANIARHIDDPYQIRLIATLSGAGRMIFYCGDEAVVLPARPGEVWFINTAFEHAVRNDGNAPVSP